MDLIDKSLILDFEKYLEKKKHKLGIATHGFDRGQHELLSTGIEVKKTKDALWSKMRLCNLRTSR